MNVINVPVAIVEGNLANLLTQYIKDVKLCIIGDDFKIFRDETILYALLEYSRFDRVAQVMSEPRINYIVRKCVEFQYVNNQKYKLVESDFEDSYEFSWVTDGKIF